MAVTATWSSVPEVVHADCRYEFKSTGEDGKGARVHALLAALVIKGRLWLAGGTVPEQQWSQAQPGLTQAVDTFRLVRPVR